MPWIILVSSAVFEAVWATALGMSENFTRLIPSLVFVIACIISMAGLGWAAKHIPIGTAYAVWVGIGAALTVAYAMVTGTEAVSVWKIVFLTGIIGAVIGLKLVPARPAGQLSAGQPNVGQLSAGQPSVGQSSAGQEEALSGDGAELSAETESAPETEPAPEPASESESDPERR